MLDTGNNKLPEGVVEYRIPIHFTDTLKTEGLKVFQSMMFSSGDAHDLWWTGQEFKDMRVEACEQMLTHDEQVRFICSPPICYSEAFRSTKTSEKTGLTWRSRTSTTCVHLRLRRR